MNPQVTILIPNYKTPDLTKLCLRLLRKYTDLNLAHFIVIDNNSQDESVQYLRTLSWIQLIERPPIVGESPALSHARALDLGLEQVTTPYVLSIHTDTLAKGPQWLPFLLQYIQDKPNVAGVGSWKLESKPFYRRWAKLLERQAQMIFYRLFSRKDHMLEGVGKNYYYLRSHCALYRMDLLKKYSLSFADAEATAGKLMHKKLVEHGYEMIFLPSETLGQYIDHINHATMILNPDLGARDRTIKQGQARIKQRLNAIQANKILADASLDGIDVRNVN